MELYSQIDLAQLCRVCMNCISPDMSSDIYSVSIDANLPSLREMLSAICPSLVFYDDTDAEGGCTSLIGMPRRVCHDCKYRIEAAYNLHIQCIDTEKKLWEIEAIQQEYAQESENFMENPALDSTIEFKPSILELANLGHKNPTSDQEDDLLTVIKTEEVGLNNEQTDSRNSTAFGSRQRGVTGRTSEAVTISCKICSSKFGTFPALELHFQHVHAELLTARKNIELMNDSTVIAEQAQNPAKQSAASNACSTVKQVLTGENRASGNSSPKEGRFTCLFCPTVFKTFYKLHLHRRESHTELFNYAITCTLCSTSFETMYRLNQHRKVHSENANRARISFPCKLCKNEFTTCYRLKQHKVTAHPDKFKKKSSFKCKHCSKVYSSYYKLKLHREKTHDEGFD